MEIDDWTYDSLKSTVVQNNNIHNGILINNPVRATYITDSPCAEQEDQICHGIIRANKPAIDLDNKIFENESAVNPIFKYEDIWNPDDSVVYRVLWLVREPKEELTGEDINERRNYHIMLAVKIVAVGLESSQFITRCWIPDYVGYTLLHMAHQSSDVTDTTGIVDDISQHHADVDIHLKDEKNVSNINIHSATTPATHSNALHTNAKLKNSNIVRTNRTLRDDAAGPVTPFVKTDPITSQITATNISATYDETNVNLTSMHYYTPTVDKMKKSSSGKRPCNSNAGDSHLLSKISRTSYGDTGLSKDTVCKSNHEDSSNGKHPKTNVSKVKKDIIPVERDKSNGNNSNNINTFKSKMAAQEFYYDDDEDFMP